MATEAGTLAACRNSGLYGRMKQVIIYLLAPTRLLLDSIKPFFRTESAKLKLISHWIYGWLTYSFLAIATIFSVQSVHNNYKFWIISFFVTVSLSRINEIILAFGLDALDRLENRKPELSGFQPVNRIYFLGVSYIEIAAHFAIMAFLIQILRQSAGHEAYNRPLHSIYDAVYFSTITITTTGYGDIVPVFWASKLLSMYEALSGLVLFVLSLGVYLGAKPATVK